MYVFFVTCMVISYTLTQQRKGIVKWWGCMGSARLGMGGGHAPPRKVNIGSLDSLKMILRHSLNSHFGADSSGVGSMGAPMKFLSCYTRNHYT